MNKSKLYILTTFIISLVLVVSMFIFPVQWYYIMWGFAVFCIVALLSAAALVVSLPVRRFVQLHHTTLLLTLERRRAAFAEYHHEMNVLNVSTGSVAVPAILKNGQPVMLPEPAIDLPQTVPYLTDVLKDWHHPLVIFGQQQEGKTRVAVAAAQSLDLPITMLAIRCETMYHSPSTEVYAEEDRAGQIAAGVEAGLQVLSNYQPHTLLIDDLTNLSDYADLQQLIKACSTQATAHKVRVIITIHSLDKSAFGLSSVGAGIKNNFSLLKLEDAVRDDNLKILQYPQYGRLHFPARWKDEGRKVQLPDWQPATLPDSLTPADKFIIDYYTRSQNENIADYVGPKNGQNTAIYKQMVQEKVLKLGLPEKEPAKNGRKQHLSD